MSKQIKNKNLQVGDWIIDINGDYPIKGYGRGIVKKFNNERTFFFVKFFNRKELVLFDQSFFRYDKIAVKGARRAYTEKEFIRYVKAGHMEKDVLDDYLWDMITL